MPARFSRPETGRFNQQANDSIMRHAGNTATWRQFVSATSGSKVAGIGASAFYREQVITGVFGRGVLGQFPETQIAAGMQAAGMVLMSSPHPIGRRDEIVWRGATYRVESDAVPARMVGHWQVSLKRATL